ncbi:hypothetical protein RB195_022182 [Necator americanus]
MKQTLDNGSRLVDLCEQTNLTTAFTSKGNYRRHQLTWQRTTTLALEEQRKRKMPTLKHQIDYVLTRNIPLSDIRKSTAVWDVAFVSDHHPVLLSFMVRFQKRSGEAQHQLKLELASLKNGECRKKFELRSTLDYGLGRKTMTEYFNKCIQDAAKETLPVLTLRKKFTFASVETISTYNSVCVARKTGDFSRKKRLRRLRR